VAEPLRVLVAGWPNSPHVSSWADSVRAAGHEVHVAGRNAPQLPPAAEGPHVHVLPADGPPLIRSLRQSRALAELAAELMPDLVHAHWLPESGWMAARERLRPLVVSAWGSDVLGVRGLGRRRSRQALADAQLVFADSAHLARATSELGGGVPVEVARWGLDLEQFSPGDATAARARLGLPADGALVVSVRGLDPLYNPDLLLEAFERVRKRRPEARLLLKSPGEAGAPAAEGVTMLGNVPSELMPDVYRAADVVVSLASSDSSPRSVWEALACARPVVVSDLPWARDELAHGRNALLTKLDVVDVADAIEQGLDEPSLGAAGRSLAAAELDPTACTARIDALYRAVVRAGPS
jgi:glycosyltransferase involved in cell wall biosynthesis